MSDTYARYTRRSPRSATVFVLRSWDSFTSSPKMATTVGYVERAVERLRISKRSKIVRECNRSRTRRLTYVFGSRGFSGGVPVMLVGGRSNSVHQFAHFGNSLIVQIEIRFQLVFERRRRRRYLKLSFLHIFPRFTLSTV